jgi:hypothetical protein
LSDQALMTILSARCLCPHPWLKWSTGRLFTRSKWEPSDDGRFAIVEFATRDRAALDAVAAEPRVVKSFQKGIHKRHDIERELQKYKKDFRLDKSERKPRS